MFDVRDARREDYGAFARFFLELGVPDPTPTEEQFDARIRPHAFFLCEEDRPVAYAFWHALETSARISHIVVDPSRRGRGIGGALMRELAGRAIAAGCSEWQLSVKPDNVPAVRLYERNGMRVIARASAMEIGWDDVSRLPRDAAATACLVAPEDEAAVEQATGLLRGRLGALRAGGGRVFVGLRRAGALVAVAAFDPTFPGAMPFSAADPALAGSLLEAMRPHARPEHRSVRLVANTEEVARAVIDAGGRVVLDMLTMEGPLRACDGA